MAEVNVRVSDSGRLFPDAVVIKVDEQEIIAGQDGISPVVTVTEIGTAEAVSSHGYEVYVSDAAGVHTYSVYDGASAYAQAVAGGYSGTEEEFAADLIGFNTRAAEATAGATAAAAYADAASDSATAAATSESNAADSATAAASSASEAASSAGTATTAAGSASSSATAAAGSATTASNKASEAASSESNAASSATAASASATAAAASETAAASSASSAASSATAAAASAAAIEEYEHDAEAWAIGKRGGVDVDSSDDTYHNNSKYYAEQAAANNSAAAQKASEAASSAQAASQSAQEASASATAASQSKDNAASSATAAAGSATAAAGSASTASTAATTAQGHATNAASSATAASGSATSAASSATAAGNAQTAAETAQAAAEDAQEAAEAVLASIPSDYTELSEDVDDLKSQINDETTGLDTKAPVIINSASGDIASFADGADGLPIKQLTVNVEPIQDLHGYDSPWPAGGGVNLLPFDDVLTEGWTNTENGITATYSKGIMRVTGTSTSTGWTNIVSYASAWYNNPIMFGPGSYAMAENIVIASAVDGSGYNNKSVPFTADESVQVRGFYIAVNAGQTVDWTIPMMFVKGTTRPVTYAPYSNICPISGHESVDVWDDPVYGGTIKWNQVYPLQNFSFTGTNFTVTSSRDGAFVVQVSETATSSTAGNVTAVGANTFTAGHIYAWLGSKNEIRVVLKTWTMCTDSVFKVSTPNYNNITIIFTNLQAGTYKVYPMLIDLTVAFGEAKAEEILAMGSSAGAAYVKSLFPKDYYDYDVSYGETCVSAVNGNPYRHVTIQLGDTVYGGTLDVTGGKMVINRKIITLDGSENVSASQSNRFYITISDAKTIDQTNQTTDASVICDKGKPTTWGGLAVGSIVETDFCCAPVYGKGIAFRWDSITTAADWKTYFTNNPTQFSYELATPIEITLTPTQIDTLLGTNNIWADAGTVDVDYRADTKLYIDNIHQPTEDDMTADAQIASGKYFLIGGNLYKSTTVIPAGDTIIPGTNCVKTNLAEALNALNT